MPNWRRFRYLAVALPAALVTFGLYTAMMRMVVVDEIELTEAEPIALAKITPDIEDPGAGPPDREPAERIEASTPPPPPRLNVGKTDINLPAVSFDGAAPAGLNFARLDRIAYPPAAIGNRGLIVVRPPVLAYPAAAIAAGREGTCEVSFSVDTRGRAFNVSAVCSHPVFERPAERAVSRAEFGPRIVNDTPVERHNVVYPLDFTLS